MLAQLWLNLKSHCVHSSCREQSAARQVDVQSPFAKLFSLAWQPLPVAKFSKVSISMAPSMEQNSLPRQPASINPTRSR